MKKSLRFLRLAAEIAGIPSVWVLFFIFVMTVDWSSFVYKLPAERLVEVFLNHDLLQLRL